MENQNVLLWVHDVDIMLTVLVSSEVQFLTLHNREGIKTLGTELGLLDFASSRSSATFKKKEKDGPEPHTRKLTDRPMSGSRTNKNLNKA